MAITQIVRSVSTARIYSDSAVAGDILKRFEVVKIKAHRQDTEAICDWDLYTILGNRFADMSAKAVLTPDNCRSVQLSGFSRNFYSPQYSVLEDFLQCLIEMDRQRMDKVSASGSGGQQVGAVPKPFLSMNDSDFCVLDFPDPPLEAFQAFPFFLDRGGSMGSDDSVANQ